MSNDIEYHRAFEKFTTDPLGMWPEFKANPRGLNYRGQDAFRKEFEDKYAEKIGAFYAYQRIGKGVGQIRIMPKAGQAFWNYATEWEDDYSSLTTNWTRRVEPVVDEKLKIVGHLGWWWCDEILIPKTKSPNIDVQGMVDDGLPVFASEDNFNPSQYHFNEIGNPKWKYKVLTNPDGVVESVFAIDGASGATATMAPWEAVSIGRAAITVASTGRRYIVSMVSRKGSQRAATTGSKEAAEAAAQKAAASSAQAAATSGTVHSVSIGPFGSPGHLVARIQLEEGRVVYLVRSIHLKAEGKAIELKARAAHRGMIQRAAQEAQKRGQKEFTLRGIDANPKFQAHANKLADEVGVAKSGKASPSSTGGYPDYEVTLDTAKVLASGQTAANTAAQAARGAPSGAGVSAGSGR